MNEQVFGERVVELLYWLDDARADRERYGSEASVGYYMGVLHAANIIVGDNSVVVYDKESRKHKIDMAAKPM